MCGQPGGYGQQGQMQMPKFNPMTTNPSGGPPGHFMDQWQNPTAPQMQAPQFRPHYAPPWMNRPTAPQGYAGSTGTGEPMPMGQQQPATNQTGPTVPPWMQDPTMGQTFAFNRRPFR